ncbi:MAG: cytochrome b N-terminal domain-containing protein [Gemmatimonadota bacterium]
MGDFVAHLFPRRVRGEDLRLRVTFCLGGLAFTAFLVLGVSGFILLFFYLPSPARAFESILLLESGVPGGRYLRSLHRMASHLFLAAIFLHSLRVLVTGAYRKPRELNWVIGFCLLGLCIFNAYTGYLLPMDQTALWATQTGMHLLRAVPLGEAAFRILVPDGVGQDVSLHRFYALHVALAPLLILVLSLLHFYRVRKDKRGLPDL